MPRPSSDLFVSCLTVLGLVALVGGGCKDKEPDQDGGGEIVAEAGAESSPDKTEAGDEGGEQPKTETESKQPAPEQHDPRAKAVEIVKADAAATVKAKGAKNMGFSIDKIAHLFALDATLKVPGWGAAGEGEVALGQDDDMDTAWRCEVGQDKPCVLGLALPEAAKVEAVRLYTAAGPRWRDYKAHPRLAEVRVHTDAGYVDVKLADGANHTYVRFADPVETQSLALEVLSTHEGNKDAVLGFAEVEVYGTDGVPRPPMALDPAEAWLNWETTTWGKGTIRQLFVYQAQPGGGGEEGPARRRIARATGIFGHAGDDYALFERLNGTTCETADGSYVLFDKRSRMYYPLGDLGGAAAEVYRHSLGHGFAVGWRNDEGEFTIAGVVEEEGKLRRKRPPKDGVDNGDAQLREWGFETKPLSRGESLTGVVAGCHRAGGGELSPVESVAPPEADMDPSKWMVCNVGDTTVFASAPCGGYALAYQMDSSDKITGEYESKNQDARGLRLRRSGDALYLELSSQDGDSSTLYLASPEAFVQLERNGGLAVRPPSECRACSDAWINPYAFDDAFDEEAEEAGEAEILEGPADDEEDPADTAEPSEPEDGGAPEPAARPEAPEQPQPPTPSE